MSIKTQVAELLQYHKFNGLALTCAFRMAQSLLQNKCPVSTLMNNASQ